MSVRSVIHRRPTQLTVIISVGSLLAASCSFGPREITRVERTRSVTVRVVDEFGAPLDDVSFEYADGERAESDGDGNFEIDIAQPVAGVLTATGKLTEPLVVSPTDDDISVRLFDRVGPNGLRLAYHFGGDVMLGRRYQANTREGTALANDATAARAVVSDLTPLTASADMTVVNVETVIGDLADDQALAGKRFLIQSPPQILDSLRELGVDAVTLGNNHANDWGDLGVLSTFSTLGPTGIVHAGAGVSREDATRGVLVNAGGRLVGLISATTVNGDFVNDELPRNDDGAPGEVAPGDEWQYDLREFGYGSPGDAAYMELRERRAGSAWRVFRDLEPTLSENEVAELWAALTDPLAYPELQDWVARRGHGGAAQYLRESVAAEIDRLRAEGASSVVVQFHAGFQFSERPSGGLRRISRDAIDDGADMVISHHPHVLQGFEWYRGRLVAYSLGNLLFDQDFLSTYPTAILRVVTDESGVIEARALPAMLSAYRPVPVAGSAAERIVRLLDTRSMLPGVSRRIQGLDVAVEFDSDDDPNASPATVMFDRNSGLILPPGERPTTTLALDLPAGADVPLPPCQSLLAASLPADAEYGADLFGWGAIDDVTADRTRNAPMHWVVRSRDEAPPIGQGVSDETFDDAVRFASAASLDSAARFASRVSIEPHRWFDAAGQPVDRDARYVLAFDARRTEGDDVTVEIDVYHVVDEDPNSDPFSTIIRTVSIPVALPQTDVWTHVELPLDASTFAPNSQGLSADAVLVKFEAQASVRQVVSLDNVRFMEWREAPTGDRTSDRTSDRDVWLEADALRSKVSQQAEVTVAGCASG